MSAFDLVAQPRVFAQIMLTIVMHVLVAPDASSAAGETRARSALQVLYDFSSTDGAVVKDRSGVGDPVDLKIADVEKVRRSPGALEIRKATAIRSGKPAAKLIEAVRRSGEVTVEAWIRPAKRDQVGPARIVTISRNSTERNVTLGQDGDRYDVRFRTSETSANGIPSVSTAAKNLSPKLTHVVYTRDRTGRTRIYLDGKQAVEKTVAGDTINWHGSFKLTLANEVNGGRQWLGTYHLVAIYSRDLLPKEIEQNFQAGPNVEFAEHLAAKRRSQIFETGIAPVLSNHCIECHGAATNAGGLDLSHKVAALAGGDSGKAFVPGQSKDSLLWELVESDDMPKDRPPLSDDEKQQLRTWIDDGAVWSLDVVDPAVYVHDARSSQNWIRRLTVDEYIETVRRATGVDIGSEARELLPADLRADGFSNTAYNLNVDLKHVGAYARLAEIIVQRIDVMRFASRYSRRRRFTDKDMGELIEKVGKWLLRGPLEEHEVITYRGISTTVASAGGDIEEAVGLILEAMLQSPRFIYRVENQRGDGSAWPAGDYEMASRLSYILWGGPPDRKLMRAADDGELDEAGVAKQVDRMLNDPRTAVHSRRFISEWLNLPRLDNMSPDRERFPDWDPTLAIDMRNETLAFFDEVVWTQQRPLAELLNAQVTWVTPRLAEHYGLEAGSGTKDDSGRQRYDLTKVPGRGGLLTQGSLLTVGGDDASMVTRGLLVMHELLRGVVKDPPPCVDTTPVPTKAGLTQRSIAEQRIANKNCGGCHGKFEPLAFGLEKFDGLGVFRERDEHGNRLRDDGEILFPLAAKPVRYKSSAELMNLLAQSERVRESLTWKVTQFALGRPLSATDAPILAKIHESSQKNGGTYSSLMKAIITSDLVKMTRTESD